MKYLKYTLVVIVTLALCVVGWVVHLSTHRMESVPETPGKIRIDPNWRDPPIPGEPEPPAKPVT